MVACQAFLETVFAIVCGMAALFSGDICSQPALVQPFLVQPPVLAIPAVPTTSLCRTLMVTPITFSVTHMVLQGRTWAPCFAVPHKGPQTMPKASPSPKWMLLNTTVACQFSQAHTCAQRAPERPGFLLLQPPSALMPDG